MNHHSIHHGQTGAALIVALIILLLMTVLGLTSMNTVTMEERMAGNLRDLNLSFQGAEAAVRDAEKWLAPLSLERPTLCSNPPCATAWQIDTLPDDLSDQTDTWWITNGREYGTEGSQDLSELSEDPRFVIEFVATKTDAVDQGLEPGSARDFYLVTGRAVGGSGNSETVIQTYVAKRLPSY